MIPTARELFRKLKRIRPTADIHRLNEHALCWCREDYGQKEHGTTGRAPMEVFEQTEKQSLKPLQYVGSEGIYIRKLDHDVTLKKIDLSLKDGYIHLIRFIRSDCQPDVFREKFKMPERVMYEYVIATICTEIHTLQVRIDNELIETYEYPLPIEYERW